MVSPPLRVRTKNYSDSSLEEGEIDDEDDEEEEEEGSGIVLVKPELSYEKAELMEMAQSPLCR